MTATEPGSSLWGARAPYGPEQSGPASRSELRQERGYAGLATNYSPTGTTYVDVGVNCTFTPGDNPLMAAVDLFVQMNAPTAARLVRLDVGLYDVAAAAVIKQTNIGLWIAPATSQAIIPFHREFRLGVLPKTLTTYKLQAKWGNAADAGILWASALFGDSFVRVFDA